MSKLNFKSPREAARAFTHLSFYVGFPGAITASAMANATFSETEDN
ncbi:MULTISPECIES: hypothetical protein [unclassified Pseudomonas]|jgi:4-carboxymuconolactone decarboxylase|nr:MULTISPECIES: hypothetical protein [unclassified Pseudomonas]MBB6286283.1 alkylhydroperoxidase/carboxymuconolactone decarboxylase family protein YurZ [Pseudomonas sp. SJZ073]MBB6311792.1 alkylhydroperoxidase/carboxymuconolactone decarboxylase family protein YurZ [Pseudomonas sp. JAI120]